MAQVRFTQHLSRFFLDLEQDVAIDGNTVARIVEGLERRYPGMAGYLVDDQGSLRQHVNIFIGDEIIRDRSALSDPVAEADRVFVLQALSGG